jgi:molybdenum-dependent DNA-binding transcriptional regulator ModE
MSYRKAWGMLHDVEKHLGFDLTEKRRGGAAEEGLCFRKEDSL